MFSISACEAADVSSPMEMAVEVVNGNIFYNSPLEETIRIHLHYITLHQDLTISVLTIGRDQVPRETSPPLSGGHRQTSQHRLRHLLGGPLAHT